MCPGRLYPNRVERYWMSNRPARRPGAPDVLQSTVALPRARERHRYNHETLTIAPIDASLRLSNVRADCPGLVAVINHAERVQAEDRGPSLLFT